jgi:hypothetical protein
VRPRLERDLPDAGDRRQRFAPEPHRADPEQVVGGGQFAGGVLGERQRQVVRLDAAPVVRHADQFGAAGVQVDVDARRPGVDGVFEQLLDDGRRPFDHLAGRDLGDHVRGQLANAVHCGLDLSTSASGGRQPPVPLNNTNAQRH